MSSVDCSWCCLGQHVCHVFCLVSCQVFCQVSLAFQDLSVTCHWPVRSCHWPFIGLSRPVSGPSGPVSDLSGPVIGRKMACRDLSVAFQGLSVACQWPVSGLSVACPGWQVCLTGAWFSRSFVVSQQGLKKFRTSSAPSRDCNFSYTSVDLSI